jgi:putative flippase GtrA
MPGGHARGRSQLNLIRDLYSRFHDLIHEFIKFGLVGGLGSVVQLAIQNPLHLGLRMQYLLAEAIGIAAGIVVTFFGNRYWTYRDKRSHGREFFRETTQFLFWCLVGLVIQLGIQLGANSGLNFKSGLAYNVVTVFGIGVAMFFRWWAYRTFVFRAVQPSGEAVEALEPEFY